MWKKWFIPNCIKLVRANLHTTLHYMQQHSTEMRTCNKHYTNSITLMKYLYIPSLSILLGFRLVSHLRTVICLEVWRNKSGSTTIQIQYLYWTPFCTGILAIPDHKLLSLQIKTLTMLLKIYFEIFLYTWNFVYTQVMLSIYHNHSSLIIYQIYNIY